MDVLRRVPLRVHEDGVLAHFLIVLLFTNLHLDICRHKVVIILFATMPLRSW